MQWLQRNKPELILMDWFWKLGLYHQEDKKKWSPFYSFSWFFTKCYIEHGQLHLHWTKWIQRLHISLQTPYVHCAWTALKKIWKKLQKGSNFFGPFCRSSLIFSNGPSKWVPVCWVAISASRRFIWDIKQHYPMIFHFHYSKGWLIWFRGGLSSTPRRWTGQK